MKITIAETEDWQKQVFQKMLADHNLEFIDGAVHEESTIDPETQVLGCFVNSRITEKVLDKLPKLKFIATLSTGFDHIDIKAAAARGIVVSNVPSYGENTVAEFAFALILSLSRQIYPAIKRVREAGKFSTQGLKGFDLKGKTLGVVGTGRIGARAVKMAKGFEMEVVAYDPYPNEKLSAEYGFKYLSLDELLKVADIVSLHVPYMPATHHLINAENLKLFKSSALLINTARGGLVDTMALLDALKTKRLAGAGLDVLEEEGHIIDDVNLLNSHPQELQMKTVLADHELMQMENVIVTPHNAFNSAEALERILQTALDNIQAFIKGQSQNVVK